MYISTNKYPILKKIKEGKLGEVLYSEHDRREMEERKYYTKNEFYDNLFAFRKNTFYICETIVDCMIKSSKRLVTDEIVQSMTNESGLILFGKLQLLFNIKKMSSPAKFTIFVFQENFLLYFANVIDNVYDYEYISHRASYDENDQLIDDQDHGPNLQMIVCLVLSFLKYAKVETKELKPAKKVIHDKVKYFNGTNSDITIVDSLWFTTLVKSNAFKVSGHFRLQPYKNRKELIWIADFEKSGYTRKAKILSYNTSV